MECPDYNGVCLSSALVVRSELEECILRGGCSAIDSDDVVVKLLTRDQVVHEVQLLLLGCELFGIGSNTHVSGIVRNVTLGCICNSIEDCVNACGRSLRKLNDHFVFHKIAGECLLGHVLSVEEVDVFFEI